MSVMVLQGRKSYPQKSRPPESGHRRHGVWIAIEYSYKLGQKKEFKFLCVTGWFSQIRSHIVYIVCSVAIKCDCKKLNRHNLFKLLLKIHILIYFVYLKFYTNDSQGIQVMETVNMHCKSISQMQSGVYSGLKVISLVEHIEETC